MTGANRTAMTDNFAWARYWHGLGYNVVPQARNFEKYPGIKWKELQTRRVTESDLFKWHFLFENGGGFITGEISNTVVIESDGPEGEELLTEFERLHGRLPPTLTIRSGSGRGLHRHFLHPGHYVVTRAKPEIKLDVKGDRGFAILPPSLHKSGGRYEIVSSLPPSPLPKGLLDFIELKAAQAKGGTARVSTPRAPRKAGDRPILDRLEQSFHPISPMPPAVPLEKVAGVLARYWPRNGGRHAGALIFGGVLFRAGYDVDAIGEIIKGAAELAGDGEIADRVLAACGAVATYEAGGEIAGIPRLREAFGNACANQLALLLDYGGGGSCEGPARVVEKKEKARLLLEISPRSIRALRREFGFASK
ncbi:MAG: bifunctional DNA primase/polymerase [Roseiarcus sp.]